MSTRKTKATIAAVALSAVALTGSTLALWSDSASADASALTSGHLTLTPGAQTAADVSPDVTPTTITLDTFRVVPGDTIRIAKTVTIDAVGDNLEAELTVAAPQLTGDGGFTVTDARVVEGAYDADDAALAAAPSLANSTSPLALDAGDDQEFTVVYDVDFDASAQEHMDAQAAVGAIQVALTQVRS